MSAPLSRFTTSRHIPTIELPHELHVTFCLLWDASGHTPIKRRSAGRRDICRINLELPQSPHIVLVSEQGFTPKPNAVVIATPVVHELSVELTVVSDMPTWVLAFSCMRDTVEILNRLSADARDDWLKRYLTTEAFRSQLSMQRQPAPYEILRWLING